MKKDIELGKMIELIDVYLQSEWYFFVSNEELDVDPKVQRCLRKKSEG